MAITITHASASASILAHVESRSLTQGEWHGRGNDGRDIGCLLGSMHPSVGSPKDCNGDLMPMWLAELTPTLFDGLGGDQIYPIAERYGRLIARWHILSPTDWAGLLVRFLVRIIDDAVETARPNAGQPYWAAIETACRQAREAIETGDLAAAEAAAEAARGAARAARAAA